MGKAVENKNMLLKFLVPIAVLFSGSLFMSNKAYAYSSVAFLQFIKEANLTVVYLLSCCVGLQTLCGRKVAIIVWIITGCSMCVHGEINFMMTGLILQVAALFCECAKNVMGELVLTGQGLKLDPLTFNFFTAPLTFIPLFLGAIVAGAAGHSDGVFVALCKNWYLILPNSMMAFVLNITLATVIKNLSAISFVLTGLVKDVVIVMASCVVFGDAVSLQQFAGFTVILFGVALWSCVRFEENASKQAKEEDAKQCGEQILDGRTSQDSGYGADRPSK
jgi:hypothetical protein